MTGYLSESEHLVSISGFLGGYYALLALMNGIAATYLRAAGRLTVIARAGRLVFTSATLWMLVALAYLAMVPVALSGEPRWMRWVSMPQAFRDACDAIMGPTVYSVGVCVALVVLFLARRFFTRPAVAWTLLNLALLVLGLSMTDPDFAAIVAKPDNVPIVGMVFLLGYFTWLATRKAVVNDDRIARGLPVAEEEENERVLVWPDLVYIELICMVAVTVLLLVWSIALPAPLEEPANVEQTPNPSKAPWYFLGLQEMLVYFDPWMAGVVLPALVILGLLALPYLDANPLGNGYYTIIQRKFAYVIYQFGFLVLWITMILLGTFLRGPNWNFFGVYETWDARKVQVLNNVDLSEYFWIDGLGRPRPEAPADSGLLVQSGYIAWRELPGILLLGLYFGVVPLLLTRYSTMFKNLYPRMKLARYAIMMGLLLVMTLLPIKMICRWLFNLKYFVSIPEFLLNV
ncbi:MAG: hypothetical protein FJ276_24015 [Planctomycetes bacterium]|nr:hypothetical protein [Planctomycetota bacterium]